MSRGTIVTRLQVAVVMGSDSDIAVMGKAADTLKSFGVEAVMAVASAHRSPGYLRRLIARWEKSGVKVFIAGAGGAAHLAGAVASLTAKPVIGVPLGSKLNGLDSLLSTVQMPKGVPVATVAVENAENAAILAAQILAVGEPALARTLAAYKVKLAADVIAKSKKMLGSRRA